MGLSLEKTGGFAGAIALLMEQKSAHKSVHPGSQFIKEEFLSSALREMPGHSSGSDAKLPRYPA